LFSLLAHLSLSSSYAFSQIALYGMSYIQAAKASWRLLMDRGCAAMVNDSLVNGVTMCSAYCGGAIAGVVGVFVTIPLGVAAVADGSWWYLAGIGFVAGFASCLIVMESVEAGVTCLFVCLAEQPRRMRELRPQLWDIIVEKYPAVVNPV
jgi:hypothetical protein